MPVTTKCVSCLNHLQQGIIGGAWQAARDGRLDCLHNSSILAVAHTSRIGAAGGRLASIQRTTPGLLHPMPTAFILSRNGSDNIVAYCDCEYAEEDLCEALWLVNMELRAGLPRRERIEARRQIAHYESLLSALRSAGA